MKKVALLIPACKSNSGEYLADFLQSIKDNSISVFSDIYIVAQNYEVGELSEIVSIIQDSEVKVTIESCESSEFDCKISKVREHMRTNCPKADYYMVVDDDMIHNEGAGDYIKSCIEVLESRSDAVVACMTKSWRKYSDGVPYVTLNTWNNVDMLNGILIKSDYFLNEFKYDDNMIVGEDTSMFIDAFLDGHAMLKFYSAPMVHIRDNKPEGLTNYYRTNSSELMSNGETSITKYKTLGMLKFRPKIFTEPAIKLHKANYFKNYGKYPDYLGKYEVDCNE